MTATSLAASIALAQARRTVANPPGSYGDGATGAQLARENIEAYEYCRDRGHLEFVSDADICDNYVRGNQWDPKVKAILTARKKPYLTINQTLATFATLAGEQLSRRADISFRPSNSGVDETASALDKLWVNFTSTSNYDWLESRAFWDGVIRSRGFLDMRMDFSHDMRGDVILNYLNSKDVLLFPDDSDYDPDKWTGVIVTNWITVADAEEVYGVSGAELEAMGHQGGTNYDYADWYRDTFGWPDPYESQVLNPQLRRRRRILRKIERQEWEYRWTDCFVDRQTGDTREVPDNWDRERVQEAIAQFGYGVVRRRVRKIRWVVSIGGLLMHNTISPYQHFTPIPYFPFLIGGRPVGIVKHLLSPQDLLNKSTSQELHIVAGMANSGYKVRRGALANMTVEQLRQRGGEDGIVIETNGPIDQVDRLKPSPVPPGVDRLSTRAQGFMRDISLVSESLQGLNRADESGDAIQEKRMSGTTSLSLVYASIDQMRRLVARNWLDLTQQFVTEPRIYRVAGASRAASPEEIQVNQPHPETGEIMNDLTLGEYSLQLVDVPSRQTFDESQLKQILGMIKLGAPIPWSHAVAVSTIDRKGELVKELKQQEGSGQPSQQQMLEQQLKQRMLAAQAADKESSAAVKGAQAQKAMIEAHNLEQGGGDNDSQASDFAQAHAAMATAQNDMDIKTGRAAQEADVQGMRAAMEQREAEIRQRRMELELQDLQEEVAANRELRDLKVQTARARLEATKNPPQKPKTSG